MERRINVLMWTIVVLIFVVFPVIFTKTYIEAYDIGKEVGFTNGLKFAITPLHSATKDTNHIYKISVVEKDTISITVFSSKKIKRKYIKNFKQ